MSDLLAEPSAHAETVARLAEVEKQLDAANLEIGRLSVDAARTPKPMDTRNYLEGFLIGAASCGIGTTVGHGEGAVGAFKARALRKEEAGLVTLSRCPPRCLDLGQQTR